MKSCSNTFLSCLFFVFVMGWQCIRSVSSEPFVTVWSERSLSSSSFSSSSSSSSSSLDEFKKPHRVTGYSMHSQVSGKEIMPWNIFHSFIHFGSCENISYVSKNATRVVNFINDPNKKNYFIWNEFVSIDFQVANLNGECHHFSITFYGKL